MDIYGQGMDRTNGQGMDKYGQGTLIKNYFE
jgi:hypothetical protein